MRGEEPSFVGGRRVTTPLALELVRMVLSGLANKQLVSALSAAGARRSASRARTPRCCRPAPIDVRAFGSSGTPARGAARSCSPCSPASSCRSSRPWRRTRRSAHGALNVNGDDAAAAIAAALGAQELFLMADVAGVLDAARRALIPTSRIAAAALVATAWRAAAWPPSSTPVRGARRWRGARAHRRPRRAFQRARWHVRHRSVIRRHAGGAPVLNIRRRHGAHSSRTTADAPAASPCR